MKQMLWVDVPKLQRLTKERLEECQDARVDGWVESQLVRKGCGAAVRWGGSGAVLAPCRYPVAPGEEFCCHHIDLRGTVPKAKAASSETLGEAPKTLRVEFWINDTHVAWVKTCDGRVEVVLNDDAGPWDMALFDGLVDLMRKAADWRIIPTPLDSGRG